MNRIVVWVHEGCEGEVVDVKDSERPFPNWRIDLQRERKSKNNHYSTHDPSHPIEESYSIMESWVDVGSVFPKKMSKNICINASASKENTGKNSMCSAVNMFIKIAN